jgi:hypothetical protein
MTQGEVEAILGKPLCTGNGYCGWYWSEWCTDHALFPPWVREEVYIWVGYDDDWRVSDRELIVKQHRLLRDWLP